MTTLGSAFFLGHSYIPPGPSSSFFQLLVSFTSPDSFSYSLSGSSCFLQGPQMAGQPLCPPTCCFSRPSYPLCLLLSQLPCPWIK